MNRHRFRFDVFEFNTQTLELFRSGTPVHLQRQPALALLLLLERAGELVTRQDLQDRIWGSDRNVDLDRSIAYCLRQVRSALGDEAASARFVETLRGVGYRFIGPVTKAAQGEQGRSPLSRTLSRLAAAVSLATLAATGAGDRAHLSVSAPPSSRAIDQDTIVRRAYAYLDRRDVKGVTVALQMFERVLPESPKHVLALAGAARATASLALHYREPRLGLSALHYANMAMALSPDDPGVLAARAQALHAAGHVEDATAAYAKALRASTDVRIVDDFAMLLYQRGRIDQAIQLLAERWRSSDPDAETAGMLGTALGALGFGKESRGWLKLSLALAPDAAQAKYLEGLKAFHAGRFEEARAWIAPLLEERDPGTLAVTLASRVDARERGPAAALPRLLAAVEATPEAYEIRATLAQVYRAVGQADAAEREQLRTINMCRSAAAQAPQSPLWPRCLASALADAGSLDEAVQWYTRAVELGWRKPAVDHHDNSLALLASMPKFMEAQKLAVRDLDRMRAAVLRAGVPLAPAFPR